ncbi:DUF6162 family protein [Vibrio salilacus]|uniref:DUF6162 family protein n=1 Tax=Vibrio salilacus TaxID=1323749 RepID=UPI000C29D1AF|nr:hypothetical protein [Vibrio salilacus]
MIIDKVRSDNGSREGKWVALTVATILAVSLLLLPHHQAQSQQTSTLAHQVLVTTLEQDDLAMLVELKLAHEEIRDLYLESGEWPDVSELQRNWIAPFVPDQSWQRKGSHQWQQLEAGLYLGVKQDRQGSALMLLDSRDQQADIWLAPASLTLNKSVPIKPENRQLQGWQQVILAPSSPSHSHAD